MNQTSVVYESTLFDIRGEITENGIYTLKVILNPETDNIQFIMKNLVTNVFVANTGNQIVKTTAQDTEATDVDIIRNIWFNDISINNGIKIVNKPINYEQQEAPVILADYWKTVDGTYGKLVVKSNNKVTLYGSEDFSNEQNGYVGPYLKEKANSLSEGKAVVDEINVMIDPTKMGIGEKFSLTTSLNDKDNNYLTEVLANFWKDNNQSVSVSVGLVPEFSAQLKTAGLYTIRYEYIPGTVNVFANFTILKDGEEIASTTPFLLNGITMNNAGNRGYIWFNDISLDDGLDIYSLTSADYSDVDEALKNVPQDLSIYTDKSVKVLNEAIENVVRGKNALEQEVVDGYAVAINQAIKGLDVIQIKLTVLTVFKGETDEIASLMTPINSPANKRDVNYVVTVEKVDEDSEFAKLLDKCTFDYYADEKGTVKFDFEKALTKDTSIYVVMQLKEEELGELDIAIPPTIDTTKPVKEVTVGVDKAEKVEEVISNSIEKDSTLKTKVDAAIADGKDVKTEVVVKKVEETKLDAAVKKEIDEKIKDKDLVVAQYLDLSIVVSTEDKVLGNVTQLTEAITYKIAIPADLAKEGREFVVVRVHDGVAEILPTTMNADGTLSFTTDRFSTYALVYKDAENKTDVTVKPDETVKPTTPEKEETVNTGDQNNVALYASLCTLALLGAGIVVLNKKREELLNK